MEGRCNVSPAELFRGCEVIGEIRSAQGLALAGGIWATVMNARLWAGCPHPSAQLVPHRPCRAGGVSSLSQKEPLSEVTR